MKVLTLKQEPRKKPVKVLDSKTVPRTEPSLKNWYRLGILSSEHILVLPKGSGAVLNPGFTGVIGKSGRNLAAERGWVSKNLPEAWGHSLNAEGREAGFYWLSRALLLGSSFLFFTQKPGARSLRSFDWLYYSAQSVGFYRPSHFETTGLPDPITLKVRSFWPVTLKVRSAWPSHFEMTGLPDRCIEVQVRQTWLFKWLGLQNPINCAESKFYGGLPLLLGEEQEWKSLAC